MTESPVDVAAIRASAYNRWLAWYHDGCPNDCRPDPEFADEWPENNPGESMSHYIVRNDVPTLLDALDWAQAASEGVDLLIAQAERRGAVKALLSAARKGRMSGELFPRQCVWLEMRAESIESGADL